MLRDSLGLVGVENIGASFLKWLTAAEYQVTIHDVDPEGVDVATEYRRRTRPAAEWRRLRRASDRGGRPDDERGDADQP